MQRRETDMMESSGMNTESREAKMVLIESKRESM